jgi:hypothetical protein
MKYRYSFIPTAMGGMFEIKEATRGKTPKSPIF